MLEDSPASILVAVNKSSREVGHTLTSVTLELSVSDAGRERQRNSKRHKEDWL